jgi:hypothetical protein
MLKISVSKPEEHSKVLATGCVQCLIPDLSPVNDNCFSNIRVLQMKITPRPILNKNGIKLATGFHIYSNVVIQKIVMGYIFLILDSCVFVLG